MTPLDIEISEMMSDGASLETVLALAVAMMPSFTEEELAAFELPTVRPGTKPMATIRLAEAA